MKASIPVSCIGILALATPDWCNRLSQLESVGGRAHEAQYVRFVWSGGGAAYCNDGADAFSRYAFRERHWHPKVLQPHRRDRKMLGRRSTANDCTHTPCATRLENITTTVVAPHNRMRARSRPRRETSGADLRHAIKNSLLPRGVFVTRVTDITHIILLLHCRRRSWRQAILRDEEPNLRRRCLLATRVALWPQRKRTDHSQADSPTLSCGQTV